MKIIDLSSNVTRAEASNEVVAPRRLPSDATNAVRFADRVNLSQMAAALADAKLTTPLASASPKRLEALREAVANGSLEVDNEALAKSIVEEDASWPGLSEGVRKEGVRQ